MTKRRVLVVDDSPFISTALGAALRDAGFEVETARDLAEIARARPPDLVLMDVVLPEAYGDDIAAQLRESGKLACPILLMSSLPDHELAERARDTGLEGYVSKQSGLPAMVARVRAFFGDGTTRAAPAAPTPAQFEVNARQRMRRVLHVAAQPTRWNAPAILIELDALAGDADLTGATELAAAARVARDTVAGHGIAGATPEIREALRALARRVGAEDAKATVLLLDDTDASRAALLEPLDRAGHVVVEGRSVSDARLELHAAEYTLVVVNAAFARPELMQELAGLERDRVLVVPAAELAPERILAALRYH